MKIVIVGCGRVGATLAESLEAAGHDIIILDTNTAAFNKLHAGFKGSAIRGDGTDEDVLRRAGATDADLFLAMTEGDNRNVMAAQLAGEALGARRVVAKINDPLRADAYTLLGIATLCRTNLMADAVYEFIGMPRQHEAGIRTPVEDHAHHLVPGQASAEAAAPLAASTGSAGSREA